ncbi:MAG: hypothetical protein HYU77_04055 [Betaproteobacteria bacterium]|nr:hypothetical protein [Betaproteobacteria bacterium]
MPSLERFEPEQPAGGDAPGGFEGGLAATTSPVAMDLAADSRTLLVAFGGIAGALGMPPFEFFNLCREVDTKKIFVRDLRQAWYHQGLPGIADDIGGIAAFLREKIAGAGVDRVVLVGNSMGGYAAIVFGLLLEADEVHAFGPQTFIDRLNRLWHRDARWPEQMRRVHRARGGRKYFDLKKLLQARRGSRCRINVYYSPAHPLDKRHAERLGNFPNVSLHPFAEGGHVVIRHLRDSGALKRIILGSLRRGS